MNADTLRTTHVPAGLPPRQSRPAPTVVRLFSDHGWAARMWFAVAVCALFAALVEPYLVIAAYRTRERVVILDEAGTFHVSPLLNFEDATQLHTSQAILACLALFQKNPTGYDYPDLLEKMYLPDALEKAKALRSAQAAEFSAKQIHQKVEISENRHSPNTERSRPGRSDRAAPSRRCLQRPAVSRGPGIQSPLHPRP